MDANDPSRQLGQVVQILRRILGDDATGIYLYGSSILGGLRQLSDLDVMTVSRRRMTLAERRELAESLMAVSALYPPQGADRPLEVSVVVQSDIRPWRYPTRLEFQYGEWLRAEFQKGNFEPWSAGKTELAIMLTMVRQHGEALHGLSPTETIDPVPEQDLIRAMTDGLSTLVADAGWDGRNVILTLARIWFSVTTGRIESKDKAAEWALPQLDAASREVMAHARDHYLGLTERSWEESQPKAGAFASLLERKIRALL